MITTTDKLEELPRYLASKVIGQEDAIEKICAALTAAEHGLNDTGKKPRGSFLFMGPTGVGKTSVTKAVSEFLFGTPLQIFFMNELQNPMDVVTIAEGIKKVVYQFPEGGVFLFDEIEKAHKSAIDLFLSLLEEGEITMSDGKRISIAKWYVVMTSNIGAEKWAEMRKTRYSTMEQFARDRANKMLRPELIGRITEVIVFRPLGHEVQIRILNDVLAVKLRFLKNKFGEISVHDSAKSHLLRTCFSKSGGARKLKNELDRQVNAAMIPYLDSGKKPYERRIYYEPQIDRLVLR